MHSSLACETQTEKRDSVHIYAFPSEYRSHYERAPEQATRFPLTTLSEVRASIDSKQPINLIV